MSTISYTQILLTQSAAETAFNNGQLPRTQYISILRDLLKNIKTIDNKLVDRVFEKSIAA